MLQINVRVDVADAVKRLQAEQRRIPISTAIALTRTANKARAALVAEMGKVFDRPTPYTLRAAFISPATVQRLEAVVGIRDQLSSKARITPAQLLEQHFVGGSRRQKQLERLLAGAGLISGGEYIVPGAGAKLDRFGNMNRGQITQLVSQLRTGNDASSFKSNSRRSVRARRKAGRIFWSRGNRLPRGAWIDYGEPVGLRPLLVVVSSTSYRRIINLPGLVRGVVAREFTPELERQLSKK